MKSPMEKVNASNTYETIALDNTSVSGNIKAARDGNVVTLIIEVDSGLTTAWSYIKSGTNPINEKYRPKNNYYVPAMYSVGNTLGKAEVLISTTGSVQMKSEGSAGYAIATYLV